ncbi:5-methylcytosine-specific restriction endonuclease McrA [Nocardia transvalensis]|uniref:5-methylcytosine-specific restriction endonuclease McrA n=1 Tax=Nocardia transvalensis TaxID=37333 RepID=A0A7W9PJD4_9NOCA|nr:HNH endonuclease [Nocardia transvalensis]MBB5917195.1 5-methylcytosine-specific restriction endonuclease McrA [Nocardia transvalensis]
MPFHRAADAALTPDNWIHAGVLVLNASYEALTDISADRAVVLLLTGTAEIVAVREPHFPIRSKHLEITLPQAIRLRHYVYLEHRVLVHDDSRATLAGVLRRDAHRCGYCAGWARTVDHIRPRSRGGPNTWNNLIAACGPCNTRKADRTPEEAGMRLLWEPKAPNDMDKRQRRIWKALTATT